MTETIEVQCPECGEWGFEEPDATIAFGVCPPCFDRRMRAIDLDFRAGRIDGDGLGRRLIAAGVPPHAILQGLANVLNQEGERHG